MIKEIMLASALTFNSSQVYDINNSFTQYLGSISASDLNSGVNTLIIDLNSGDSFICNLTSFEDGALTLLEGNYVQPLNNDLGPLNLSHFINYLYSCFGFNSDTIWTNSYMEMVFDFDLDGLVLDGNMNNNCYYTATLGCVAPHGPNTFYQLCSWYKGSNFDAYNIHSTHSVEFDSFIRESFTSDLYLILTFHNMYISQYDIVNLTLNFSYEFLYFEIQGPLGMWRMTSDLENRYTNFIYDSYYKLQEEYEDLQYDYVQLEGDYDAVRQINNELFAENERLNSKFVFNNTFDLLGKAVESVSSFLNIQIAPNLSIGMLVTIPIVVAVALFVLKGVSL